MGRRFYDPQPFQQDAVITLGNDVSHHISRVLRMREGDALTLFNGQGGEWQAQLVTVSKSQVQATPLSFTAHDRTPVLSATVALPMIKGDRMDIAIQKATELGAAQFQLIETEHSDVRLTGERLQKKLAHWQRVAISACEQCGMNRVPAVRAPITLTDCLRLRCDGIFVGQPNEQPLTKAELTSKSSVIIISGPEGGFSDAELNHISAAGARRMALGERILRAETAPTVLLASLWALLAA